MADGDTPAEALRAHRDGDGERALDILIREVSASRRELREGLAAINTRLAQGDTAMALQDERQGNQGKLLASLVSRFDAMEREFRAMACDDCETRIETLEDWKKQVIAGDAALEKARTWQPSFWLLLLLMTGSSLISAALASVIAAHMGASP